MPRGGGGGGGGAGRGDAGRGRKKNHKGQRRMFTDEEELKEQATKDEKAKAWRRQCGIESSDEEEDKEGAAAKTKDADGSESSSEESTDEDAKPIGVSHLIQIENPNRTGSKAVKKVTEMAEGGSAPLSRREREELEKQEARRKYQLLHAAGKTDEAQADLARLAIIRKQREEAAKKRVDDKQVKDVPAPKKS